MWQKPEKLPSNSQQRVAINHLSKHIYASLAGGFGFPRLPCRASVWLADPQISSIMFWVQMSNASPRLNEKCHRFWHERNRFRLSTPRYIIIRHGQQQLRVRYHSHTSHITSPSSNCGIFCIRPKSSSRVGAVGRKQALKLLCCVGRSIRWDFPVHPSKYLSVGGGGHMNDTLQMMDSAKGELRRWGGWWSAGR